MTTTTKPSEGAMRAANAISHVHRFQMTLADRDECAGIIDREIGTGEMLKALEAAYPLIASIERPVSQAQVDWMNAVERIIRRAREGRS